MTTDQQWADFLNRLARAALARREDAALTAGSDALTRGQCGAVMLIDFQGLPWLASVATACQRPPHGEDVDHYGSAVIPSPFGSDEPEWFSWATADRPFRLAPGGGL